MARNVRLEYPNRDKAASKLMRLVVVLVLLASSALIASVTIRGWDLMQSARVFNIAFIALNIIFVLQILRWSRGVLPMAAGVATFVALFSGIAIPSWYSRDAAGYNERALSGDLGTMTVFVFAAQFVVIVTAIAAFAQNWQIEVEKHDTPPPSTGSGFSGAVTA
jgi:hypothetical protein